MGRPLKYKNIRKLKQKINEYFLQCDEKEKPYGIVNLALHLGISRQTLINYEGKPDFVDTIQAAKQRCEAWVEEQILSNKLAPASGTFWMKNHGWQDKQTIEHNDITELSEDQLKAKLASLLSK